MLGYKKLLYSNLSKSFQAGVDTLYNKCKSCGSTPSNKTPTAISTAIQSIYTNRYNSGYNAGDSAGYTRGYNAGKSVGYYQTPTTKTYSSATLSGTYSWDNLFVLTHGKNVQMMFSDLDVSYLYHAYGYKTDKNFFRRDDRTELQILNSNNQHVTGSVRVLKGNFFKIENSNLYYMFAIVMSWNSTQTTGTITIKWL